MNTSSPLATAPLHRRGIASGDRDAFGKHWQAFLRSIDEPRREAGASLVGMLRGRSLRGDCVGGGSPYEVTTLAAVFDLCRDRGFTLRSLQCSGVALVSGATDSLSMGWSKSPHQQMPMRDERRILIDARTAVNGALHPAHASAAVPITPDMAPRGHSLRCQP